jgi:hypothetical protein
MRRNRIFLVAMILVGCGSGTKQYQGSDGGPAGPAPGCSNGEQSCEGMNIRTCKNGGWATETCDHVCQQSGMGPATSCQHDPAKGFDACFCSPSTPSPACQDGQQKCSGLSLSVCNGGTWKTDTCDNLCHQGGLGKAVSCGYDAQKGKEICLCYDGTTGDPCTSGADCTEGSCGTGGWCSKTCSHDSECGQSSAGNVNYCMQTTSGNGACFPYCSSGTMCTDYPGTSCQQGVESKDGSKVDGVCTL